MEKLNSVIKDVEAFMKEIGCKDVKGFEEADNCYKLESHDENMMECFIQHEYYITDRTRIRKPKIWIIYLDHREFKSRCFVFKTKELLLREFQEDY